MSLEANFDAAFEVIRKSHDAGRLAHAYLIVGSPQGDARVFAENMLKLLFCTDMVKPCGACLQCDHVHRHVHPDILWLEPEGKARMIKLEMIRETLLPRLSQSSYEGGWKAAVLLYADCLNEESSNALLKTLEEPSPRSLLLLVTDSPQALLPTILSRCQRINLSLSDRLSNAPWRDDVMELLRSMRSPALLDRLSYAYRLKDILDEERNRLEKLDPGEGDIEETEDIPGESASEDGDESTAGKEQVVARITSQVLQAREEMLTMMNLWMRDLLVLSTGMPQPPLHFTAEEGVLRELAAGMTSAALMTNIRVLEEIAFKLRGKSTDLLTTLAFESGFLDMKMQPRRN